MVGLNNLCNEMNILDQFLHCLSIYLNERKIRFKKAASFKSDLSCFLKQAQDANLTHFE